MELSLKLFILGHDIKQDWANRKIEITACIPSEQSGIKLDIKGNNNYRNGIK